MIRNNLILHGLNRAVGGYVPSLSISPDVLNFNQYPDTQSVDVYVADVSQAWGYEISSGDEEWITVSGATGIGDDSVDISVTVFNPTNPPRTGTVTFTSDLCANVVLTVNQDE